MRTDSRCLSSGPATASGHLLNPTDPESDDRDWIRQTWEWLLRKHLGLPAPEPSWLDQPAIARHFDLKPQPPTPAHGSQRRSVLREEIKPFNFLSIAFVHPLERPPDDPRLVLIGPYRTTPDEQLTQPWINRHSGKRYHITTTPSNGLQRPGIVTVKTYRDMLAEYAVHPNPRATAPTVNPATARPSDYSRGARHCTNDHHIGKEATGSRSQAGLIQGAEEDPRHLRRHRSASAAGMGAPDPAGARCSRGRCGAPATAWEPFRPCWRGVKA